MQDIVYKLVIMELVRHKAELSGGSQVPSLEKDEYKRERDFYAERGMPCPKVCHFAWLLRRGVRSDAQLSPTETRFQKCSQSGKNGSKHPMLPISMAYYVISCKKIESKH